MVTPLGVALIVLGFTTTIGLQGWIVRELIEVKTKLENGVLDRLDKIEEQMKAL